LITDYGVVFLSRPRRFGKSLTCSTLGSIFKNERELFKGLAINESDWEWKEYPVIHLDLGIGNYHNGVDTLRESLNIQLESHANKYEVAQREGNISTKFSCLIEALHNAKGKVVVIIDEYDNPLLSTIDNPDINKNLRNELRGYLSRVDYSLASKITEYYFEFAVSNIINMIGFPCFNEVHTANGRMDSIIFAGDYIYIIEFKVNKPVEDAIAQFVEKDYASVYADSGKKLVKLAVVFDREKRNIERWERVG